MKEISKSYAMDSLSDKRWQTFRKIMIRETAFEAWTGIKRWNNHPQPNTKITRNHSKGVWRNKETGKAVGYYCSVDDFIN